VSRNRFDLMTGFSPFIATIDFEATALSKDAAVIEVGVAIFDRHETIKTWSSLVKPRPGCLWSEKSAQVHKITRSELEMAPDPTVVVEELNRVLADALTVYCDGLEFDRAWMGNLFRDGERDANFTIAPIEAMSRMHFDAVSRQVNAYLDRTMVVHRAREDAQRLMQAYTYAIGKKTSIVALA
jgi:DNA polymerase III epsilon subunit-like protein